MLITYIKTFIHQPVYFTRQLKTVSNIQFTIAVKYLRETGRYGLVQFDKDGRITNFWEKEPLSGSGWINGGIYLIRKEIFDHFPKQIFSLENDVFKVSCSSLKMQAFHTDSDFLDMGIPEDYVKAQIMIKTQGRI